MRLTRLLYNRIAVIRNQDIKVCIKCVSFIRYKNNYPYDSLTNNKEYGKCSMFGEKNMVTGDIEYINAARCRADETKCGRNGNAYEELSSTT
jgi:hypothetical protein